ncbi:hypothetical protein [Fusobacterium necrophorum]|uniref:Lipoprotein n=3 Tax=Fusobacterium necrophorum TaxID=859 RepID=A0A162IUT5_9FUSO|nr:hypothetical protein [Fusobacterium necrophorum]EHO21700.1 hypothetical protein HMPREF9466_00557 [Fusobacterium necrophorum subsp. funduliforme 1_1_36S]AVQ20794.1 hypothetical protein C4N15_03705 [Fusobacterium necrophorum subsp. funduliforme]AYV92600.1 hypothetical protein BSQ88_02450 [Fusobacterium necrophorum subsp. funduliforme]EIJ72290.1 hypothetical protein HMPREF1049_0328 [Fusobacterium necrophorum subsp. funduliforme ATCC 51357]EYD69933.1 hypothetical protein FNF_01809 [Fusobacteriu
MKKVLTVIFLIYLFASCSNLSSKTEQNFSREQWKFFVSEVKEALEEKKIENLQEKMLVNVKNKYLYQELVRLNIQRQEIQFYFKEPEYNFPKIQGLVAIQYGDRTEYFTIFYVWKQGKWWIYDLEKRR